MLSTGPLHMKQHNSTAVFIGRHSAVYFTEEMFAKLERIGRPHLSLRLPIQSGALNSSKTHTHTAACSYCDRSLHGERMRTQLLYNVPFLLKSSSCQVCRRDKNAFLYSRTFPQLRRWNVQSLNVALCIVFETIHSWYTVIKSGLKNLIML
jgi:hypothetical protein